MDGITYCVRGKRFRARQVVIKSGEEILWAERIRVAADVGSLRGSYGLEVLDLNLDGRQDLMIPDGVTGECLSYLCWLQTEDGSYQKSEALSGLCNLAVDPELKAVFAFSHDYDYMEGGDDEAASSASRDITTKYVWKRGKLVPEMYAAITYYTPSNLYCFSVAYYDEASGSFSDPDDVWLTPDEYAEKDMSFLYYFR